MTKLATSKRMTLPNGRIFVTRYKRIKRSELPANIVMKRTYRDRAAVGRRRVRRHQGQAIFDFVRKVAKNPLVKTIAKKGLEYASGIYHNLSKRVKKKFKKNFKFRCCSFGFK